MARKELTWTPEQQAYLRKHFAVLGVAGISKALGRTKSSIWQITAKLGLRKLAFKRRRFPKRPTHLKCRECGEWFSFSKTGSRKQKFCTISCAAKHRMRNPKLRKAQSRRAKTYAKSRDMSELGSRPWRNPETRARLIEKIREHTNSKKHLALMAEHNKKLWANAEFRKHHAARTRRRAIEMWSNPEYRNQKSIETTKKNIERWADPKYKTRVSAAIRAAKATTMGKLRSSAAARAKMQCPERRAQAREIMTTRWQDSEYRTRMTEQSRATAIRSWNDPFFRARAIEQIRVTMQSPEHRARVSEQNKRLWADPEYRERQKKLRSDPEFKARAAERNRQRWADPKYRRRVSKAISKAKKGKPTWRSRETN